MARIRAVREAAGMRQRRCGAAASPSGGEAGGWAEEALVGETGASAVTSEDFSGGEAPGTSSELGKFVTDTVEGIDMCEVRIDGFEFFPDALDVAVDGSVVDIGLVVISCIHQLVAAFHMAGPECQHLEKQKLGYGKNDLRAIPCTGMPSRIEYERAAHQRRLQLAGAVPDKRRIARWQVAAHHRANTLDQQTQ